MSKTVKFIEEENIAVDARGCGSREVVSGYLINRFAISIWDEENCSKWIKMMVV